MDMDNQKLIKWINEQIAICIACSNATGLHDIEIGHYEGRVDAYKSVLKKISDSWADKVNRGDGW